MSGIKRYLSDNAYKAAEHSESPSESNPFVTLHKAIAMRSDWNQSNNSSDNYILNKPAIKAGQGENSIIEGYNTQATGNYSHAEGGDTTASGLRSHAEGGATTASGNNSHAEGYHTTANHKSQHVFGEYNIADPSLNGPNARGNYVEIVGNGADENTRTNARTLDWQGNETLAGSLTIGGSITANGQQILPQKQADWNQANSESMDYILNKPTIPDAQVQSDWNQTTSTGSDYILNKPAIKAGQGVNSIIESKGTAASGENSHAEGTGTTASNTSSHAEGRSTTASGVFSHAEGDRTTAIGNNSHTEGCNTNAIGNNSHAEGCNTNAGGAYSHAEGGYTTASGDYSHAEGGGTTASGGQSHAEGNDTKASGGQSHTEGSSTTASGTNSHAEGGVTIASGDYSHAEGGGTKASGNYSHVEGNNTTAKNKSQHVFGEYNVLDPSTASSNARGNYVEIVGNGTNANKSNARTLDWSGNETLAGNLTVGGAITANGQQILPQKQADWNQTTSTGSDYIKNKPTKLSDFINDGEGGTPADPFTTTGEVNATFKKLCPQISTSTELSATTFNSIGVLTKSITFTLPTIAAGTAPEFNGQFTVDSNAAYSVTFPAGIVMKGDTTIEASGVYQFSICNGYGIIIKVN